MKRQLWAAIALTMVTIGLGSCAAGDDDEDSDIQYDASTGVGGISYNGVWAINGTRADTRTVRFSDTYHPMISFEGFPFEAVVKWLYPDIGPFTVTYMASMGTTPKNEDALWMQTIRDYGDNSCIEVYVGTRLNSVGYSERMRYYELLAVEGAAYRYLPFVVTPYDGSAYFALLLDLVPARSTVTLDTAQGLLSCTLIVKRVEKVEQNGQRTVRDLQPEMKLTFTSVGRQ